MHKWLKLFKDQYLGFWILGLVFFILQEVPYIIMPFISLDNDPLMNMVETSTILNILEKILGISCIVLMCFVVKKDASIFILGESFQKLGFVLAIIFLLAYYFGWILYFNGHQSLGIILGFLVAMPPLYYAAIGLWRENWILLIFGLIFLIVHLTHVHGNFMV